MLMCPTVAYLKETVTNECHQQLVPKSLPDQSGVLRGVHACEVKHRHIRLPAVVRGIIQRGELVVGAKVSSLSGVAQKSFLVDIFTAQQQLSLGVVLSRSGTVRKSAHGRSRRAFDSVCQSESCLEAHEIKTKALFYIS